MIHQYSSAYIAVVAVSASFYSQGGGNCIPHIPEGGSRLCGKNNRRLLEAAARLHQSKAFPRHPFACITLYPILIAARAA